MKHPLNNMTAPEQDKLIPAIASAATQIAAEEGITDESESIVRANAILEDAKLDEPATEAGKRAKSMAGDIIAAQATAALQTPKFDYDKFRNETAIPAIGAILKKMGEQSSFLAIPTNATPEYEQECEDAYQKLVLATFAALDANNVGMSEYKYVFDSLKSVVAALEENVMQQIIGHRHEIMSRTYTVKNPGTGKFDANYATYGALKTALDKVRKDTGDNVSDYFTVTPKA